jgi:chemotaxis protein MotB
MKKLTSITSGILVLLAIVATSCVPAQKFKEIEKNYKSCSYELDQAKEKNEQLSVDNTEMKEQIKRQEGQLNSLIKDSMSRTGELKQIKSNYSNVNKQNAELQEAQEAVLKGNARETAKLMLQLQTAQDDLKRKEDALKQLEKTLDDKKKNLDQLNLELEKRDARLIELERILFRKDSAVNALKTKIAGALTGFGKEDLDVTIRNGKVYVSMEEKLLFKSGSTAVDPKGVEALKKLGHVLEQNNDINITIEGHTDNVPYKSGMGMNDNWDLSVMRSTSIIRILTTNSKIEPKRITASGRGEYSPIASNGNSESRAKNRRTEIILTPKLDEIFKILEGN